MKYLPLIFAVLGAGCTVSNSTVGDAAAVAAASYNPEILFIGEDRKVSGPQCHFTHLSELAPVHYPASGEIENGDQVGEVIVSHFTGLGVQALKEPIALEQLKRDLLLWARENSLSSGNKEHVGDRSRLTLNIMAAYAHNRGSFSDSERAEIEGWFKALISEYERTGELRSTPALHNITYRVGALQMALGILTNDERSVKKAIRVYKTAIDGLREDGSFVNDSERGGNAIHYQNISTAHLTTIADMAANQGINLYDYTNSRGKNLETAVRFLLAATEEPSLIYPYAKASSEESFNGETAQNPYAGWHTYQKAEWAYYWVRRFPDREISKLLAQNVEYVRKNIGGGTNVFDSGGGTPACFSLR